MKRSFFQAAVVSILLYGCTTWTLTKRLKKKLDGNYTRMLRAILNKSWRQHLMRHQLYGYLPPITKTIQVRRTRHAGHCWRSKDELISDVPLWTPTYGQAKAGRPARTYIQQLCEDTGCNPEDLPEAMNDREKWRARIRDICDDNDDITKFYGHSSFIHIHPFLLAKQLPPLNSYLIIQSFKQGSIKYHFEIFVMTRPGNKPRSRRALANTLPTMPMERYITYKIFLPGRLTLSNRSTETLQKLR